MAIVNEVRIEWDALEGAVSYNVYRSADDITYAQVATGVTDSFYTDPTGLLSHYYKISGVDQDSIEGELSDPILPYDPMDVCLIRGSIVHPDGNPADGEPIEIVYYVDSVEDLPRFAQGNILTRKQISAFTDSNGVFEVPVAKLALITFTIRGCGYSCKLQIPDVDSLGLEDLATYGTINRDMEYPF